VIRTECLGHVKLPLGAGGGDDGGSKGLGHYDMLAC
jgi:hypothetical protein